MGRRENINPSRIHVRHEHNSRFGGKYDHGAIEKYRRNGYSRPVIVSEENGKLYADDGSHRVLADRQAGRKTKAVVTHIPPRKGKSAEKENKHWIRW